MFTSDQMQNYELNLRIRGGSTIECEPGETKIHVFDIHDTYHLTGAEYFREGNLNDTVSFSIVVSDSMSNDIAKDIFMGQTGSYHFYRSTLRSGFSIKVTYKNMGSSTSSFRYNLIMHQES